MIGAWPVTLSLVNELDSVSSNGSPAWDSARYLREILKAPVYEAAEHTPLQEMPALSARLGNTVEVKREDLQTVHSFKIRGAYNAMRALGEAERARGVITASAGNHAQGVARSATLLGVDATIVMPTVTPRIKVDAVRDLGGRVLLLGDNFDAAKAEAQRIAQAEGRTFIAPSTTRASSPARAPSAWRSSSRTPSSTASSSPWAAVGSPRASPSSSRPSCRRCGSSASSTRSPPA